MRSTVTILEVEVELPRNGCATQPAVRDKSGKWNKEQTDNDGDNCRGKKAQNDEEFGDKIERELLQGEE